MSENSVQSGGPAKPAAGGVAASVPAVLRRPRQERSRDDVGVHGHHLPLGAAAVRHPADVRQDGAAGARRLAVGVVGVGVLLPGRAAGRLHLRASADHQGAAASDRHHPSGRVPAGRRLPADRIVDAAGASRRRASLISGSSACSRLSIGLPFMAVSANAPLLQAWFARSGHPNARDPYFLYAASNLGSLIALLGYPFVLEPAFGLSAAEPSVGLCLRSAGHRPRRLVLPDARRAGGRRARDAGAAGRRRGCRAAADAATSAWAGLASRSCPRRW